MRLSQKYFIVFVTILFFNSGYAQIKKELPKWIMQEDITPIQPINTNSVRDGYYYILVDEQFNTIQKQNYYHYAIKATTEAGVNSISQIEITYDPSYQKAYLHYIKVKRGNTIIDKTDPKEIRVLNEEADRSQGILNGSKTIYMNLSDIRKDDIVEYSYSIEGYNKIFDPYFNFDFTLSYSVPVGKITNRVLYPKGTVLNIKYNQIKIDPKIREGQYNDYTWEVNNPPIVNIEEHIPYSYDPYASVQVSNIASWNEVKHWFSNLFSSTSNQSKQLSYIADSIRKATPNTLEDQITACVDFTQNHIRYSGNENGIYSHTPHLPDYVLINRYGDCKDKSLFLSELLKQFNVTSYPVLLNTSLGLSIKKTIPSLGKFNHCILAIENEGKLYFIDPTISYQKGSFKARTIPNYKTAIVLDGKETVFYDVPADTISYIKIIEHITIQNNGDAIMNVESIFNGENADIVRYYFATNPLNDIQKSYKSIYSKYSDDIQVVDSVKATDNESGNVFRTTETYLLKAFWLDSEKKDDQNITRELIPETLNEKLTYVNEKSRKYPLRLNYPVKIEQQINIVKEEGWSIEDNTIKEDNSFFSYKQTNTVKDKVLYLTYYYESKKDIVNPEEYKLYKEKIDFLDKNIVFSITQKTSKENSAMGFNWILLLTILITIALSIFICRELVKINFVNPYPKTYDSIGSWLALVGVGLVLTPLILTFQIGKEFMEHIQYNYFYLYFNEESASYQPSTGYYLIITNIFNVFLVIASVYLVVLFFKQKPAFRWYYMYYKFFNLGFLIIDLIISGIFFSSSNSEDKVLLASQAGAITKMLIQTAIWVPYIWFSERSRHTFADPEPKTREQVKENNVPETIIDTNLTS